MKLLSLAGFAGDKKVGISELKSAIKNKDSIRYEYCAATVMGYNLFMGNIFGKTEQQISFANEYKSIHYQI